MLKRFKVGLRRGLGKQEVSKAGRIPPFFETRSAARLPAAEHGGLRMGQARPMDLFDAFRRIDGPRRQQSKGRASPASVRGESLRFAFAWAAGAFRSGPTPAVGIGPGGAPRRSRLVAAADVCSKPRDSEALHNLRHLRLHPAQIRALVSAKEKNPPSAHSPRGKAEQAG
jgi:hypothetical protein